MGLMDTDRPNDPWRTHHNDNYHQGPRRSRSCSDELYPDINSIFFENLLKNQYAPWLKFKQSIPAIPRLKPNITIKYPTA